MRPSWTHRRRVDCERADRDPVVAGPLRELDTVSVVDVDRGTRREPGREQPRLGREVLLDRAVQVEMVTRGS